VYSLHFVNCWSGTGDRSIVGKRPVGPDQPSHPVHRHQMAGALTPIQVRYQLELNQ